MLLGDLLANDYMRLPVGTALAQTVGNVLEVVLAAYLLRRAARSGYLLGRVDGLVRLLPPLALATMVSATGGDAGVAGGRCGQFGRVLDRVAHVVAGLTPVAPSSSCRSPSPGRDREAGSLMRTPPSSS